MPNSSCHFWKHKSFFLQILHQCSVPSKITPLYFFGSNILYFGQKQLIKVQILGIFECSGENLPKSSCHFPNRKEVFFSNFTWLFSVMKDNSSVLFWVKDYILCTKGNNRSANFRDFWVLGWKFTKLLSILKQQIGFGSNFASIFSIMRHNSLYFF